MSVRGVGVEFVAGPPSQAGTTRTTPDSGLGGDERGGPRVPPGFSLAQQQMYPGNMMPGPPENINYGPDGSGGEYKRYGGNNYMENEGGMHGGPPAAMYHRMNMGRPMAGPNPGIHMQQPQYADDQYTHNQPQGVPNGGPGIFGGPPIHMASNGSAMMIPPQGPPGAMHHHPSQQPTFLLWDGQQYHAPSNMPNGRPNGAGTSMSTTTAISGGSYENGENHHMQMGPPPQQFMQQPQPYQQAPNMPPMFPPQSPQHQQFLMANGQPQQPVLVQGPNGPMYLPGPGYGGFAPPMEQNPIFFHNPPQMMIRQADGTLAPMPPMMIRPPQQVPPNFQQQRPPPIYMQQGAPQALMDRGPIGGSYMANAPPGPPSYGSPAFNSLKSIARGGNRGGRYVGQRAQRGGRNNMQTPSSIHSEPRSDSGRSDAPMTDEHVTEMVGQIRLEPESSPEVDAKTEKSRKAPSKQMLQLASDVKNSEKNVAASVDFSPPPAEPEHPVRKEQSPVPVAAPVEVKKPASVVDSGKECTFCKSKGCPPEQYKGHLLREGGKLTCDNARENLLCRYCGNVGGDNAHTMVTCPKKQNGEPRERALRDSAPRDMTPRDSTPRDAPAPREGSVDSRASAASRHHQYSNRGGYHHQGHRGGSNEYKSFRGRGRNNRGGYRGNSGQHYQQQQQQAAPTPRN